MATPAAPLRALVSGYGPRVFVVEVQRISDGNLALAILGVGSPAGTHPSYLANAVTAAGPRIYAVDELKPAGAIAAFSADTATGALERLGDPVSSAGADPCHVCVHPSGHALYVSNYSGGGFSVHSLDVRDGSLSAAPLQVVEPGPHPHHVVLDAAGTRAFVAVLGADAIFEYAVAPNGTLAEAAPPVTLPAGSGPRHLALCEARGFAVAINELDCTVSLLAHRAPTAGAVSGGSLTLVETVSSLPPGVARAPGYSTAHVAISPDGRFVYGSNRGHNSLGVWAVEDSEGELRLQPVQWHSGAGSWDAAGAPQPPPAAAFALSKPRDFALSPDPAADLLLCASQLGDSLALFRRDAASGELRAVAGVALPAGSAPTCVVFPPWLQRL